METTMDDLNRPEFTTDQLIAEILANLRNDDQRDAEVLDILSDSIVSRPLLKTPLMMRSRLWKHLLKREQRNRVMTAPYHN
ncbi:MAG: hypothetical protein A4E65_03826 [Syntrophorhabdus sp. PtaU1.Bin153]|nr:MAG: hypothetical protein A4E65_03826 [Syntrophorhabdus sp. PtaU1.Bin153]